MIADDVSPTSVLRRVVMVGLAGCLLLAACSLPVDDQPKRIDTEQVPPELLNTTTTTTTTTVPATVPPSTDPDDSEPPTTTTTTTTIPGLTSNVSIYYTISISDDLQSYQRLLPSPVPLQQVTSELETPSPELTTYNLRSSVVPGLIAGLNFDRSVLTVALDRTTFDEMPDDQKRRAIAQIVLTYTSFVTSDAGAVGSVRFEIDGEGIAVFVPATGANSEPGAELKFADFQPWIASSTSPTTTTTVAPPPESASTTVAPF